MTGKQKTLKAFNFEEIDDVVYGEYGIDCDIVSRVLGHETYLRNKAASTIGLWEGRRDEVVQSWKEDLVELCGKLDLDIVVATIVPSVNDRFEKPEKIGEGIYRFRNGEVVKYSSVTNDFVIVKRADKTHGSANEKPLDTEVSIDGSVFEFIDHVVEKLGNTVYIAGSGNNTAMANGLDGMVIFSGNMEQNFLDCILDPDLVIEKTKIKTNIDKLINLEICNRGADALVLGPDLAYNSGPFISPKMFRELCVPFFKEHVDFIHSNTGKKIIKHSCGNNWEIMDDLLCIGFECYQSIQASAGMDIKLLKEKYGKKLVLWGGIQVESLMSDDKAYIKNDIEYAKRYGMPGGGFIFGASNSVAFGTNYDNYMYVLELLKG